MRWHGEALTEERATQVDHDSAETSLAQAKGVPSTTERPGSQDVWGLQG